MTYPPRTSGPGLVILTVAGLFIASAFASGLAGAASRSDQKSGPETFRATARVSTATAGGDAPVTIRIVQYTPPREIETMEQALEKGGSAGFLAALRKAPVAGELKVGTQTFTIRWARQQATARGRVISIVTDAPVYFVGGGVPGAKPRSGFDVAVLQLVMDSSGIGEGSMAAAARVKPGGATGVEVDDYASEPVKLVSVSVLIS